MSNPVVVDPEDPTVQPPVIVDITTYCINGFASAKVLVQNVDLYHYPDPFAAFYDWTLEDGTSTLEDGSFDLLGWATHVVHLGTTEPGTYTFTMTDADLGASGSAEILLADCASQPSPSPGPLPPLVTVPSLTCSEDLGPDNGSGLFTFAVNNQPGDDFIPRDYDFDVVRTESQISVDGGYLGSIGQTHWKSHDVKYVHSGTFLLTVTDQADSTLKAVVSVEVPPCAVDVPLAEPVPPLNAPQFIKVTTQCADPVLLDGRAEFIVLNANYEFLGGTGDLTFDWVLTSGANVIESFNAYFATSGTQYSTTPPLAPGTYTATMTVTNFPAMGDNVTFTIDDCTVAPHPEPLPLVVYGVTNVCVPGDDTEAVLFVVDHQLDPNILGWAITDGQVVLAGQPEVHPDDLTYPFSARHVPAGSYQLVVTSSVDPTIIVSIPIDIGTCIGPVDPVEPVDPPAATDPDDPTTTTTGPLDPDEPTPSTDPAGATGTNGSGTATGTLPATGNSSKVLAGVALLVAAAGAILVLVGRIGVRRQPPA